MSIIPVNPTPAPAASTPEQTITTALTTATPLIETALTLVGQGGAAAAFATIEQLLAQALAALAAAKGTPVTAADVLALMPAPITLDQPAA